jgi:hypothetical protein
MVDEKPEPKNPEPRPQDQDPPSNKEGNERMHEFLAER